MINTNCDRLAAHSTLGLLRKVFSVTPEAKTAGNHRLCKSVRLTRVVKLVMILPQSQLIDNDGNTTRVSRSTLLSGLRKKDSDKKVAAFTASVGLQWVAVKAKRHVSVLL